MKKSLRSFAFVAALAFVLVPSAHAGITGCDPHPAPQHNIVSTVVYTVMSFLGL